MSHDNPANYSKIKIKIKSVGERVLPRHHLHLVQPLGTKFDDNIQIRRQYHLKTMQKPSVNKINCDWIWYILFRNRISIILNYLFNFAVHFCSASFSVLFYQLWCPHSGQSSFTISYFATHAHTFSTLTIHCEQIDIRIHKYPTARCGRIKKTLKCKQSTRNNTIDNLRVAKKNNATMHLRLFVASFSFFPHLRFSWVLFSWLHILFSCRLTFANTSSTFWHYAFGSMCRFLFSQWYKSLVILKFQCGDGNWI